MLAGRVGLHQWLKSDNKANTPNSHFNSFAKSTIFLKSFIDLHHFFLDINYICLEGVNIPEACLVIKRLVSLSRCWMFFMHLSCWIFIYLLIWFPRGIIEDYHSRSFGGFSQRNRSVELFKA